MNKIFAIATAAALCACKTDAAFYGDSDMDGLDAWAEVKAGTSPTNAQTFALGRLDYDYATAATGAWTAGELWDDGDLMPAQWEVAFGTDPDRFDADLDHDGDGWTNYEEYLAGTHPDDPGSYPRPDMSIRLLYDGEAVTNAAARPIVLTHSAARNSMRDNAAALNSPHVGPLPDGVYVPVGPAPAVYPATVEEWASAGNAAHDHLAGGHNRLFAFLDLDGDGTWSPRSDTATGPYGSRCYEPAGLSLYNSVLAGPDSVTATIPLTDEMFGFPRISWPASTNENVTAYKVNIINGRNVVSEFVVEAPRTFCHEGDYIQAGYRGIDFGEFNQQNFRYTVTAYDGVKDYLHGTTQASGYVFQSLVPNSGVRRTMETIAPVAESPVYGSLVEFLWKMDWRTEGVFFTVVDDATGMPVEGLDNLYVPFPVRHNKVTDDDYYYSYIPQLENGRAIVHLPTGTYTYTITENIRSKTVTAQSVTGQFTINNEEDDSRVRAAIKGHIHYYGRLDESYVPGKVVVQAYEVSNRARTSLSVGGNPVARSPVAADGSFALHGLEAGTYGVVGWVDDDGDGIVDATETQGFGFLGQSASPIQVPEWCVPLVITNTAEFAAVDLEDVHVVLRDRDTDSDGIPNGAGFPNGEGRGSRLAAYKGMPLRTFPAAVPAGSGWPSTAVFTTDAWSR